MGIVVATVYGCLQTDLDYLETVLPEDGAFASPALFSYTLSNCFLGEAAARFGLTGSGYVVSRHNGAGLSSVEAVLEDMACGGLETALAGICDLGCPPDFPPDADVIPGAAFMVIEKKTRHPPKALWIPSFEPVAGDPLQQEQSIGFHIVNQDLR